MKPICDGLVNLKIPYAVWLEMGTDGVLRLFLHAPGQSPHPTTLWKAELGKPGASAALTDAGKLTVEQSID